MHALRRFAEPVEIAKVVTLLLSAIAHSSHGETVGVDGGFTVRR